jgi:hypothetical protein
MVPKHVAFAPRINGRINGARLHFARKKTFST